MKLFEEFENDLRDANSVNRLGKIMLANGVNSITALESGIVIDVNAFGLHENVDVEANEIKFDSVTKWSYHIWVTLGIVEICCDVNRGSNEEELIMRMGIVPPEVEEE